MRLLSVVMGADTSDLRSKDTTSLLNYGFNTYKIDMVMPKSKILGNVDVIKGKESNVDVTLIEDATLLMKINDKEENYFVNLKVDKITAPVKKGDVVGKAEIMDNDGKLVTEKDVTVVKDILKANYFDYIKKNYKNITLGINV